MGALKAGDMCPPVTDPCRWMADTNTTLESDDSPIKNKYIKRMDARPGIYGFPSLASKHPSTSIASEMEQDSMGSS